METPEIHVEELKKDPEFLANIEQLEQECKKEKSIHKGYQLLDAKLIIEAPEDEINDIFTFIQCYSENDTKSAKEMFLVLYHTIDYDELKDAMMVHAAAVMAGMKFDDFIENLVDVKDVNTHDPLAFFIQTFVQPTDILLQMYQKYVKEGKEELKVLEKAKNT
ncbi:MAG: hypothetical protein LGB01_06965 [Sulfurovum sp.]|nr:hypothetical protein [Sulfurovum sp.]